MICLTEDFLRNVTVLRTGLSCPWHTTGPECTGILLVVTKDHGGSQGSTPGYKTEKGNLKDAYLGENGSKCQKLLIQSCKTKRRKLYTSKRDTEKSRKGEMGLNQTLKLFTVSFLFCSCPEFQGMNGKRSDTRNLFLKPNQKKKKKSI